MSAPGFLNGLAALANATTNCFPMILISGSSEREIVDLQQGDYEEMDQLAVARPHAKAAFRVLHAEDIGVGVARAIRAQNAQVSAGSIGELWQHDSSIDQWWPATDKQTLLLTVDDHSRKLLGAVFVPTDTTWNHFEDFRRLFLQRAEHHIIEPRVTLRLLRRCGRTES